MIAVVSWPVKHFAFFFIHALYVLQDTKTPGTCRATAVRMNRMRLKLTLAPGL